MIGGGADCEAELAAARLRMTLEQNMSLAERERLRRREGEEQFEGRLLALAVVGLLYAPVVLLGCLPAPTARRGRSVPDRPPPGVFLMPKLVIDAAQAALRGGFPVHRPPPFPKRPTAGPLHF